MNTSPARLIVLFIASTLALSVSNLTLSEQKNLDPGEHSKSISTVRLKLQKAYDHFNKGDLKAAKDNLEEADQGLTKASHEIDNTNTKEVAKKLAQEIKELSEQLELESEQHKNAIARFWHQSTALISRQMENLIHSYTTLSTTEKTMHSLLDAKMYLFNAEHDLFVDHNAKYAHSELSQALRYMDEAMEIATPANKKRIEKVRKIIRTLIDNSNLQKGIWHKESVSQALIKAQGNLDQAREHASPRTIVHIDHLKADIRELQAEILKDNAKQQYDLAMLQLVQLLNDL